MDEATGWTKLKDGPNRSVWLAQPLDGGTTPPRVVKRFHSERPLQRLRDRSRARREERVLARLRSLGISVPKPLGTRRGERGWEFLCEWIPDAVSLQELLDGRAPWPCPPRELAISLGRTLARAHRAGLDSPDMHPGNVLIDASGAPWLIDFTKARIHRRPRPGDGLRDLRQLESASRERLSFSHRAHFLASWLRESGREAEIDSVGPELAADARRERAELLARERDRWLRVSSRCVRVRVGEERLLMRRGAEPPTPAQIAPLFDSRAPIAPGTLVRVGKRARADWMECGRALDHGLPTVTPWALHEAGEPRALLEVPRGARPIDSASAAGHRAVGRAAGRLFDRGLKLGQGPRIEWWIAEDHELLLGPSTRLRIERSADAAASLRGLGADLDAFDGARLTRGFLSVLRGGREERERVRRLFDSIS